MEMASFVVAWTRANQDLSGWAQAIGTFVALLIAIGIPAWQSRQRRLTQRLEELILEVALGRGVFFVLNDADIWVQEMVDKTFMTRTEARSDFIFSDLIDRILLWEGRETNGHRVIALYLARGALVRTQNKLAWSVLSHTRIADKELELLKADLKIVRDQKDFIKRILDHSEYRLNLRKGSLKTRLTLWQKNKQNFGAWSAPAPTINRS